MSTTSTRSGRSGFFYTQAQNVTDYVGRFFSSRRTPQVSPESSLSAGQVIGSRVRSSTGDTTPVEVTLTMGFVAPYSKVGILDDVPLINRIFLRANKGAIAVKYELATNADGNNKKHGDREKTFNNLKTALPSLRLLLLDLILQFDGSNDTGADLLIDLKKQSIDIYNPDKQVIVFHSDTPAEVYDRLNKLKESGAISLNEHYLVADKGKEKAEIKMLTEMSVERIKMLARTQFIEYKNGHDSSLSAVIEIEERVTLRSLEERPMRNRSATASSSYLFISHENDDDFQLEAEESSTNSFK